jgi:signal transduction histidine kinase
MDNPADSTRHAWQRLLPLWYGVFYVMLAFSALLSLTEAPRSLTASLALLGVSVLLGLWYIPCMIPHAQYLRSHPLPAMGYLAIGWILWFGLALFYPPYYFLLFGLYPQVFFFRTMPWKIVDMLILTGLALWGQIIVLGGITANLLITLVAAFCGIIMTLFIEAIVRQSRERHRLLRELEGTRHELALAERQAGITEERQRLAREIHDTLVQGFTSIVMHLEAAEGALPSDSGTLQRHLDQARRTARENLTEARRLMWALHPEAFDHASLPQALTGLARNWSEESGIASCATVTGHARSLRPEIEVALLRAAQEAIANAGKHAHASQVRVTLSYMEDVVALDVQDDGSGFDAAQSFIAPSGQSVGGFGLRALRRRAEQLGGILSIESAPGEGTTIALSLPAISSDASCFSETAQEVCHEAHSPDYRG